MFKDGKKVFVVVDSNNHWLHIGNHATPEQAYEQSKNADAYDKDAVIYVYEAVKETRFQEEQ